MLKDVFFTGSFGLFHCRTILNGTGIETGSGPLSRDDHDCRLLFLFHSSVRPRIRRLWGSFHSVFRHRHRRLKKRWWRGFLVVRSRLRRRWFFWYRRRRFKFCKYRWRCSSVRCMRRRWLFFWHRRRRLKCCLCQRCSSVCFLMRRWWFFWHRRRRLKCCCILAEPGRPKIAWRLLLSRYLFGIPGRPPDF